LRALERKNDALERHVKLLGGGMVMILVVLLYVVSLMGRMRNILEWQALSIKMGAP
jgi:hypothetical protein